MEATNTVYVRTSKCKLKIKCYYDNMVETFKEITMFKSSANMFRVRIQTQGLNWGLLHCRWILYQLSYQRSPCFIDQDLKLVKI